MVKTLIPPLSETALETRTASTKIEIPVRQPENNFKEYTKNLVALIGVGGFIYVSPRDAAMVGGALVGTFAGYCINRYYDTHKLASPKLASPQQTQELNKKILELKQRQAECMMQTFGQQSTHLITHFYKQAQTIGKEIEKLEKEQVKLQNANVNENQSKIRAKEQSIDEAGPPAIISSSVVTIAIRAFTSCGPLVIFGSGVLSGMAAGYFCPNTQETDVSQKEETKESKSAKTINSLAPEANSSATPETTTAREKAD